MFQTTDNDVLAFENKITVPKPHLLSSSCLLYVMESSITDGISLSNLATLPAFVAILTLVWIIYTEKTLQDVTKQIRHLLRYIGNKEFYANIFFVALSMSLVIIFYKNYREFFENCYWII